MAEVEITPPMPVPLAGFARRTGLAEGVARPILARVFSFAQDDPGGAPREALLVQADLIWWGPDRIPALRQPVRERWGIPDERVIFHATHTHSGPQTSACFAPSLGPVVPEYVAFLEAKVLNAVERARANRTPVTVELSVGECRLGVNRRQPGPPGMLMGAHPKGPVDSELTVVRFRDESGQTRAILIHFACHPTITMDRLVSAEFPGVAANEIARTLGGDVSVAYLQGCCGDINPRMVRDGSFWYGGDREVEAFGQQLAAAALTVLARPLRPLRPLAATPLRGRRGTVDLPFQRTPTISELETRRREPGVIGEWCELLLHHPDRLCPSIPLELTMLDLADGLALLAMNAEVTVPYGMFVKELAAGTVLPIAYSNGMVGYVVTAEQLVEGGYEALGSTPYFGLPAPFAPAIEERITSAIRSLIAPVGARPATDATGSAVSRAGENA